MTTLHLINRSALLPQTLELTQAGDCIVLIEDAVVVPETDLTALQQASDSVTVYAIKEDLQARNLSTLAKVIDYQEMVELVLNYDKVITW